jgi:hypothetical protein
MFKNENLCQLLSQAVSAITFASMVSNTDPPDRCEDGGCIHHQQLAQALWVV